MKPDTDLDDPSSYVLELLSRDALAYIFRCAEAKHPTDFVADVDAIRTFVPEWDGKYETREEAERFWRQAEVSLGFDCRTVEESDLPNGFWESVRPLILKWLSNDLAKDSILFRSPNVRPIDAFARICRSIFKAPDDRRKGGFNSRRWTPEVQSVARSIFADIKHSGISNEAAYRRTAARLQSEHGISFSSSTVKRYLKPSNAER